MIDANMRQGFKRWFKWLGLGLVTGAAILGLSVKTYIASLNRQEVKIAELATGNPTTFGGFTKEGKVRVYYNEGKLTKKIEIRGARQTASYTLSPDKAVDTEVTVMAGESITATVWDSDGGNMSYGWILPSNNTCGLPPYTVRDITPYITAARAAGDLLVEGHGDLRPEHVWLGPEPMIIDCLEFQREFRILDPVEELAFLAMECELLDARQISRLILAVYGETAGDLPPEPLIAFYKSYRAGLRAKIALWHIHDGNSAEAESWRKRARDYLCLAEEYANSFR